MGTARRDGRRGFTLLELMVVIAIIAVLVAITIPNLVDARKYANEAAAVGNLRAVYAAEAIFRDRDLDGDGIKDYGSLEDLVAASLLSEEFARPGRRQGYLFESEIDEHAFAIVALPAAPGTSGDKAFYVDETGVIRMTADGSRPHRDSPPIGGAARPPAPAGD